MEKRDFEFEILGYYDDNNKIWLWSWLFPDFSKEQNKLSTDLLKYGLDLEPGTNMAEHAMLKSMLVNSRIRLYDSIELDVHLAILSYILKQKILFLLRSG